MRTIKLLLVACCAAVLVWSLTGSRAAQMQNKATKGEDNAPAATLNVPATEAPTGFDNLTNGFTSQVTFDDDKTVFAGQEDIDEGLGPVYNAQSCGECHQNPVTGGISQVSELRAGHFNGTNFIDHPGGSLINERAVDASIQETVLAGNEVRTFRMATNVLGLGYVEAIDSNTIAGIATLQPLQSLGFINGQRITVPVLEAGNALRTGRFGWKNQNSSLLSFAADAYLNEMGITNPLLPIENTSNGVDVNAFDGFPGVDDDGVDLGKFAEFMRSTKAPSRDAARAATPAAVSGSALFNSIGCNICHVQTIQTAPAGTVINGGAFTVPAALGDKIIHPYSDFLLHNIGSGDGIVQNGGQSTRNKVRTSPLWGLRTHSRFMHDGLSLTLTDTIARHGGEAALVISQYNALSNAQKNNVQAFLRSL